MVISMSSGNYIRAALLTKLRFADLQMHRQASRATVRVEVYALKCIYRLM